MGLVKDPKNKKRHLSAKRKNIRLRMKRVRIGKTKVIGAPSVSNFSVEDKENNANILNLEASTSFSSDFCNISPNVAFQKSSHVDEDGIDVSKDEHRDNTIESEASIFEFPIPTLASPDSVKYVTSSEISGRRIVDIKFFFEQLQSMGTHEPMSCNFTNMSLISEKSNGLVSIFGFKCQMCGLESDICTDDFNNKTKFNVNDAAVLGCVSTGVGYSQLTEQHAAINLPGMTFYKYARSHEAISGTIRKAAWKAMEEAAKEEADIATKEGSVNENGIPMITVIADGAWSKRSYRTNYNALSGVACIIGQKTGKLLHLGVRNKYCTMCARAANKNIEVVPHACYKNWSGTSTGMESDIIVEGFKKSIELHGLIYEKLVGDGDSSVIDKLYLAKPYGNKLVEKVECRNHLLRNFCNKLTEITKKTHSSKNIHIPFELRKRLESNITRFRAAVEKAVHFRMSEDKFGVDKQVDYLKKDISNSVSHIFGEHRNCSELKYFCQKLVPDENNCISDMKKCGLFDDIMHCLYRLVHNASSLILDMNNNAAEMYNAIVCKFVGGKRINFSANGSYQTRCEAAVVSQNSGGHFFENICKIATNNSPGKHTKRHTYKQVRVREYNRLRKKLLKSKNKRRGVSKSVHGPDLDYGGNPDMCEEEYEEKKNTIIKSMVKTEAQIRELEEKTRGQSSNHKWKEARQNKLTASNFGRICKMRATTSCAATVKDILYKSFSGNDATRYGILHEKVAVAEFEKSTGLEVKECGLFLDTEFQYLGASPDGLVTDDCEDGILEVKCPSSATKMTILEAIEVKKINFLKANERGEVELKQDHQYMYQVQGQLHITKKKFCFFITWTPLEMKIQKIYRDDQYWDNKMKELLTTFYLKCLLPEIVDPRFTRNMPIRNPNRN